MVNDLLDRKLAASFTHLDADRDGFVDRADITRIADRMLEAFKVPEVSGKGAAYVDGLLRFWESIEEACGNADETGRITARQYRDGLRDAFDTPDKASRGLRPMAEATVELVDNDNDGRISRPEFQTALRIFGIEASESATAFAKLDTNGDGHITTDELQVAINDFYLGTDPDAPGNWLFGAAFDSR